MRAPTLTLEKGTLEVPENRSNSSSRRLVLPYQRLPAAPGEPVRPPLFLLNGGPGNSNFALDVIPKQVWGTRDLVMVGYRGIDGSTQLPDQQFTKAFWKQGADQSEDALRGVAQAYSAFVGLCRAQGLDIDGYTPDEVVADLESVRVLLGYPSIDLYGVSYGTRLAYLYGRDFPSTAGHLVLVAANPPGHFVLPPSAYDTLLEQYSDVYGRNLAVEFRSVTAQMPKRWLWWGIDAGLVRLGAPQLMANPDTVDALVSTYAKASRGDASALAALGWIAPMMTNGIHAGDLAFKGFSDFAAGHDYLAESSDLGQYGRSFLRGTFAMAQFIPPADLPKYRPSVPQVIQTPTLVLNGTHDSQTPLAGVKADMMPLLANGTLLELENYGHFSVVTTQPAAVSRVITQYLDTQEIDRNAIPRGTLPVQFSTDLSLIAWGVSAATVAVLALAVGALSWWVLSL